MFFKRMSAAALVALACAAAAACFAETYTPEPSNRMKINLGATPWKFTKGDINNAQVPATSDAAWSTVGIPHT